MRGGVPHTLANPGFLYHGLHFPAWILDVSQDSRKLSWLRMTINPKAIEIASVIFSPQQNLLLLCADMLD